MTVMDLARTDVIAVPPDADLQSLAGLMEEHSVGSVVVVEDDRPIGMVTDRDLAMATVGRGDDGAGQTAAEVMSEELFTVGQDAGIYETLSRATEASVRRVPIVADDGTLAGIVTLDDFVVLLASELANVSEIVQAESPPY